MILETVYGGWLHIRVSVKGKFKVSSRAKIFIFFKVAIFR